MPSSYSWAAACTPAVVVGILMQKRSLTVSLNCRPERTCDPLGDTLGVVGVTVLARVLDDLLLVVGVSGRDLGKDSALDERDDKGVEASSLTSQR